MRATFFGLLFILLHGIFEASCVPTALTEGKILGNREVVRLCSKYDTMENAFLRKGLQLQAVAFARESYIIQPNEVAPRNYSALAAPLPPASVRLVVIPMQRAPDEVTKGCSMLVEGMKLALPAGSTTFANPLRTFHLTVFRTSHPNDNRPDPFNASAVDLSAPPNLRPAPMPGTLVMERAAVQMLASKVPSFTLEVYKVLFADTGTLLLCFVDPSGTVARLRRQMKRQFPGAPARQTGILHLTLLRLLTPEQLQLESVAAIHQLCQQWTERLQGKVVPVEALWYIVESAFSTLEGERDVLPLQGLASV